MLSPDHDHELEREGLAALQQHARHIVLILVARAGIADDGETCGIGLTRPLDLTGRRRRAGANRGAQGQELGDAANPHEPPQVGITFRRMSATMFALTSRRIT